MGNVMRYIYVGPSGHSPVYGNLLTGQVLDTELSGSMDDLLSSGYLQPVADPAPPPAEE